MTRPRLCLVLAALLAGAASNPAAVAGDLAEQPKVVMHRDAKDGRVIVVRIKDLVTFDRVLLSTGPSCVVGESCAPQDRQGTGWVAVHPGGLELEVPAHQVPLTVAVERPQADGSLLQIARIIGSDGLGQPHLGPLSQATIRRMVRVTPEPGEALHIEGVTTDAAGRLLVPAGDARLGLLADRAMRIEPFIQARVKRADTTSVSGSNDLNYSFTTSRCSSGEVAGTSVIISAAPGDALIDGMDVAYRVYHSIGAERFSNALYRRHLGARTDAVSLYTGTGTGNTYQGEHLALTDYDGKPVNYEYFLGCCNLFGSEQGNLEWWEITLYYEAAGGVDLVADSIDANPTNLDAGDSTTVSYSGRVVGDDEVPSSYSLGFYLSSDASVTTSDILLDQRQEQTATRPGDTFGPGPDGHVLTIPTSVVPGLYYLGLVVDDTNVINETNEGNNMVARPISVTAAGALANLEVVSCSASPVQAEPGDSVSYSWRAINSGSVATGGFTWGIYLSDDPLFDRADDDRQHSADIASGWPAGYSTGDLEQSITLAQGLSPGVYYLGIALDTGRTVAEIKEDDNWCAAMLTVGQSTSGARRWLIPAAASIPGYDESDWRTELALVNPTLEQRTARVYFAAQGEPWPGELLAGPFQIAAQRSLLLDDVLGSLNPAAGLLWVEFDQPGAAVTSRTFNRSEDDTTFGQGIPGLPLDQATPPAELVLPMAHSVAGRFRTNLGLVQADSGQVELEVSVYAPSGTLIGWQTYTQDAGFVQISDLFAKLGITASIRGAWIRVRLLSGLPQNWTCYASVVDIGTGDPTYVMPVVWEAAR